MFDDAPVISRYTRAEALTDGVLIDVTPMARECGFVFPVAVTNALMTDIDAIPSSLSGLADHNGRLWDCLFMTRAEIRRASDTDTDRLVVSLVMPVQTAMDAPLRMWYSFQSVIGPGDEGEPVITLMGMDES